AGQGAANLDMGMDGVKEENLNTQTVNMEDVEEVKVEAVNNSAEFARIGYYNTITKRGTNQYHGEASYYHRNSALGARGFFENQILPPRLNTVSLAVQDQYYHRANMGTPDSFVKNFGWVFPYPEDQYHADVLVTRIDHKISEKNSIYGRYSGYWPRYVLNNG